MQNVTHIFCIKDNKKMWIRVGSCRGFTIMYTTLMVGLGIDLVFGVENPGGIGVAVDYIRQTSQVVTHVGLNLRKRFIERPI